MTPEQAYKVKVLLERLKSKGLDLAEDAAMIFVDETMDFIVESAVASKTPYDDVLAVVVPTVKQKLKADVVDKIDGKDEIQ